MNQTILFFLSSKDQKASAYSLLPFGQEYMRPPIGLRDCVNGPFCCVKIAWLRENEKIIAWLREADMCAWCVKGLFGVRDGVKSPFLFAWLREIGKNLCVIAWNWKNVTSLYDCVKAGKYVRDCVKMEKNLRDCVIGHPPGGARICNIHDPVWTRHLLHFLYLFITQGHTLLKE